LGSHHGVPAEQIALGNGSNELIDLICRVFASRGEHAVFGHPSFPCYRIGAVAQELSYTAVPLREHLHWSVDDLLGAVTPQTRLLFVSNPNNPTGSYIGKDDLERLLCRLPEHVLAVIDEAYVEYVNAPDFAPATDLRDTRERLAILRTFSKAYGLASLRVGYGIMHADVADFLNRVRQPFNVNALAQAAALAALDDDAYVEESRALNETGYAKLTAGLEALGVRYVPSHGNFVLVNVANGLRVNNELGKQGVIVRPVANYGLPEWLRVTVGLPHENARFLDALANVLKS
jgi:histidinol-phosphate aminotransferase